MEAVKVDFSMLAFSLNIQKNLGCFGLQMPVFYNPFQPNVSALSSRKYQNVTMEEFPGKDNMQGPENDLGPGKRRFHLNC